MQNPLLELSYGYDVNGNVVRRNENIYTYDVLDRLKTAEVDGTFLVDTPAKMGYVDHDYFVNENLDYELANIEIDFDYAASTLGLRLDKTQKVGRVEIVPNEIVDHRVEKSGIRLFYRQNVGEDFTEITSEDWVFKKDLSGKIVITFKNAITAWEIKIHSNHDERDIVTGDVVNNAELSGSLQEMVRVYGRYERTQISYEYDAVGNRIEERYTDVTNEYSIAYSYNYYAGSNRLKERVSNGAPDFTGLNGSYLDGIFRIGQNEKMAYEYDKAGNMVGKGNSYTLSGENVVFNGSEGTVQWEYNYNGRNRLNEVIKSGEKVASYGYDYSGKRLKVDEGGNLTYFVYNYLGQMIYEDQETDQKQISYYYGLGRIIAKSEKGNGVQDGEEIYYYHHDNLGSTMLITDGAGEVVFEQDYAPFGQDLYKAGTFEKPEQKIEAGYKYTGQKEDILTGLYYYGARYYDPEISRFITEDSYQGELSNPQSQNLYMYVVQNPMKYVDPSGNIPNLAAEDGGGVTSDDDIKNEIDLDYTLDPFGLNQDISLSFNVNIALSMPNLNINPLKWGTLRLKSNGKNVEELQQVFNYMGYLTGVDGIFGTGTLAKVKEFQRANGLDIDGVVGPKTRMTMAKALGIKIETVNPDRKEVIAYITQRAEKLGVPVQLALATAQTESRMLHFEEDGEKKGQTIVRAGDWGLMQINKRWHPAAFSDEWGDIANNWKDNVDYGVFHLRDCYERAIMNDSQEWGQTGLDLGSTQIGNNTFEENIARAAYALYNTGSRYYRYRLTKSEAEALNLTVSVYDRLDMYGYDTRDIRFWDNYNNFK